MNGGAGFGVNNLPDVYQFSATSSTERAVAAAAAWEQGLRGPEAAVSNGNAHNPLLSQVRALMPSQWTSGLHLVSPGFVSLVWVIPATTTNRFWNLHPGMSTCTKRSLPVLAR